jgi:hypothetical protein
MKFRRDIGLLVTLISELECRLGGGERIAVVLSRP